MAEWRKVNEDRYRLIAHVKQENGKRIRITKEINLENKPSAVELDRLARDFESEERLNAAKQKNAEKSSPTN